MSTPIAGLERHIVGSLFHMPCSALPQRGHFELSRDWGWPDVGMAEAVVAAEVRTRTMRTQRVWTRLIGVLCGTLAARPLAQLAGDPVVDARRPGVPMAVLPAAAVDADVAPGGAYETVARMPESVWGRSKRAL